MNSEDVTTVYPRKNIIRKNITRIENIILDLYYQKKLTGGHEASKHPDLGAHRYGTSSYSMLRELFRNVGIGTKDVLVDVGCGKGRVINCWLNMGLKNRMIGIELEDSLAQRTKKNLKRFSNVEIISGNVLTNLPAEADLFYLFNPFGREIMKAFIELLQNTFIHHKVRLVYNNCLFIDLFKENKNFQIEEEFKAHHFGDSHPISIIRLDMKT